MTSFFLSETTTVLAMQVVFALSVLIISFIYGNNLKFFRFFSLGVSLIPLFWSLYFWFLYDSSGHQFQMVCYLSRLHLSFGIDAVGLSLIILTSALFPLCLILMRTFSGILTFLLLEIVILGSLTVLDLLGFYILFEASLILLFLLIARTPYGSIDAAYKIVLYTMAGSLVLLPVIFLIYSEQGSTNLLSLIASNNSFNGIDVVSSPVGDSAKLEPPRFALRAAEGEESGTRFLPLPSALCAEGRVPPCLRVAVSFGNGYAASCVRQQLLGWGMLAVFAVKIPLMPVHLWLPEAHVAAPSAGSVLLAGVLLKLGGLGFLRYMIPILPNFTAWVFPLVCTMCLCSFLFSTLATIRQVDLKKIVAYSSIAHMALVTLSIFSISEFSTYASTFMMIAHGLVSPGLFLLVGILYERCHTKFLLYFSGLGNHMPIFTVCFFLLNCANLSFPLSPNFIAEVLCLVSLFAVHELYAFIFCVAQVLGAVYAFWAFNRIIHGVSISNGVMDLTRLEFNMILPILIAVFWLGIKPLG